MLEILRTPLAIGLAIQWAGLAPGPCVAARSAAAPPREAGSPRRLGPIRVFPTHTGAILDLAYSPDGTLLASAGYDGAVRLWNPKAGRLLAALPPRGSALGFSPDGTRLLVAGGRGALALLDVRTRRVIRRLTLGRESLLSLDWSRDNRLIAIASQGGAVTLMQPGTWRVIRTIPNPLRAVNNPLLRSAPAGPVRFSPDGRWLAIAFAGVRQGEPIMAESSVAVWGTGAPWGRARTLLHDQFGANIAVAFSPDNSRLATATMSGTGEGDITVWDLPSGARHALGRDVRGSNWVRFLDHGRQLAAEEGPAVLLNARTGAEVAVLSQRISVWGMAGTSDGYTLATGDIDGMIRIWSIPPLAAHAPRHITAARPARKRR